MIKKGTTSIDGIYKGTTEIAEIRKGTTLLYENYKTLTSEGVPPLTLNNCKNTNMKGYKVYGNSKQDIYLHINLCPGYLYGYPNETDMAQYMFPVKANTIYSINFNSSYSGNLYKTVWLYDTNNNITKLVTYAYGNESYNKMAVKPQQDGYLSLGFMKANAKVMVAEGLFYELSTTQLNNLNNNQITTSVNGGDLDYAPYGESIKPTPTNQSEIKNVGDKTNNLLKTYGRTQGYPSDTAEAGTTQRTYDYDTYVVGLGYNNKYAPQGVNSYSITKEKITVNVNAATYGIGFSMEVIPGETYTFSYSNESNTYPRMIFYDVSGNYTRFINLNNGSSYTINNDEVCAVFVLNASVYNTDCWIEKPQWEKGSIATTFDYYGYKISIPVRGKNLLTLENRIASSSLSDAIDETKYLKGFSDWGAITTNVNMDVTFSSNNSYTLVARRTASSIGFPVKIKSNTTYTLSATSGSIGTGNYRLFGTFYTSNGTYISNTESGNDGLSKTFTTPSNADYVVVGARIITAVYTDEGNTLIVNELKLEEGNTASSTYIPYFGPTTTNIYLDEPLRKMGDYADYIDLETQKVYTNISKINLGSITNWERLQTLQNNYYYFRARNVLTNGVIVGNTVKAPLLCDIFAIEAGYPIINGTSNDNAIGTEDTNPPTLRVRCDTYTDVTTFKNAISDKYVYYAITTPIETSITLPDILLNKGTNIVEVDTSITPSNMWIKYKGKQ